jgi:PAS domain S-box-containing protein
MVFDIHTLLLVNFIVNILSAGTMALIWYQYRRRFSGLSVILISSLFSSLGIGLILMKGVLPDYIVIVVANTLLLTGLLVQFIGLELFVNKISSQIHNGIFLLVYFLLVTYFFSIEPSMAMREIILAAFTVIFDVQICWLLFQRTSPFLRPVTRIVGMVMACHLVFSIFLLVVEISFPFQSNQFFSAGFIGEMIVIMYLLLGIWLTIALVMMVTRRLLSEVQAQEEKFTRAFHSSPYAILLTRASDGIIFEVNDGFTTITGYQSEEVVGMSTLALSLWSRPEDRETLIREISKGKVAGVEIQIRHKTGRILTGIYAADFIRINNEMCILASIGDITERKQAEDGLLQANRQLNLLSSVTRHDILNRIMVTSFYCEEVQNQITDPVLQDHLRKISLATGEIQTLIQFTGQYQELGSTAPGWQQIDQLLKDRDIAHMLESVEFRSDLQNLQIYADLMLKKVLYNLVENSLRHGKNLTKIHLSCREDSGTMVIMYEDDGGGIAADEKEKAFEKGYGKNTGLGLFLIREILSITGITIRETGIPGAGVSFEVLVPEGKYRM